MEPYASLAVHAGPLMTTEAWVSGAIAATLRETVLQGNGVRQIGAGNAVAFLPDYWTIATADGADPQTANPEPIPCG